MRRESLQEAVNKWKEGIGKTADISAIYKLFDMSIEEKL
jgi:hypothetical protein